MEEAKRRIAIIGTRNVNQEQIDKIYKKIVAIEGTNIIVHSGNAEGVDQVASKFEKVNMILPWNSYNNHLRKNGIRYIVKGDDAKHDSIIDKNFSYVWKLSVGNQKLIRRNLFIILGWDEVPQVDKVYWFTGKGVTGGTAYGVKLARLKGIPDEEILID